MPQITYFEKLSFCNGGNPLITWCNPNRDNEFSIASPLKLVLSSQNQLLDLALKSQFHGFGSRFQSHLDFGLGTCR